MGVMDTLKAILTRNVLKSNQCQTIRLMLKEIKVIDIYRVTKTPTGLIQPLWYDSKQRRSRCIFGSHGLLAVYRFATFIQHR